MGKVEFPEDAMVLKGVRKCGDVTLMLFFFWGGWSLECGGFPPITNLVMRESIHHATQNRPTDGVVIGVTSSISLRNKKKTNFSVFSFG